MTAQSNEPTVGGTGLETGVALPQDELAGAKLAFHTLIESLPGALLLHREGRVVQVNAACAELLGYTDRNELRGRQVLSLVHPLDQAVSKERVRKLYTTGEAAPPRRVRALRRDGQELIVEVSAVAVMVDGLPTVLVIAHDLTARNRVNAQLLQADRMASMGTLAAGVAHEVNNPLGFTLANVTFALEELGQVNADLALHGGDAATELGGRLLLTRARVQKVLDALQEARQGSDRVRLLVRDLKMFAGGDVEQTGPVDVRRTLESSTNMAYNAIRQRARLVKDFQTAPTVEGNESKLAQVFLNLLINASEAIAEGDAERHEIRVVLRGDDAGRCVVEVHDTGQGIAPQHLARILDPFFTTKPRNGTGLGLSICHTIVASMNGKLSIESALGRGSTFRVTLPVSKAAALSASSQATGVGPGRRARVLVVDDEPMMARAVQRLLGSEHDVEVTADPLGAVERVRAGARFDVILCDLMMPNMTGMEVYDAVVGIDPDQARRMVFMTGGAFTPRAAAFLEKVDNQHLEKPLDRAALRALVRERMS